MLALESIDGNEKVARSAQRLISTLLQYDNWGNRSGFTSYIEFLSPCNESDIFPECRRFWIGNNTKQNLKDRIRNFLALAGPNEIVVFHYYGEGNVLILGLYHEIINSSELLGWLDEVKATTICILDTCHAGSWIDDGSGGVLGPGRLVFAACRSNEKAAVTRPDDPYSVFTGLKDADYRNGTIGPLGIIGGLIVAEDSNKDGWINFMEDFAFANASVSLRTSGLVNPVSYNGLPNQYDPPFVLKPPKPPVANFSSPRIAWVNETTLFNASSSFSSNGNITSYTWNFGDDNVTSITEPVINHTYTRVGNYTVTLNVTDNFGMWNSSSTQITITYKTDINKDKSVNILDITIVATAFNSNGPDVPNPGDPPAENWNATADLNNDKWVNIIDITMVAVDFGKTT
jgi:hypothetical protein